jgi:SAM-dependent methyltransferase
VASGALQPIRRLVRKAYREIAPDRVLHHSTILPAKHLRFCGVEFKDNEYFLNSAKAEAERLTARNHLSQHSRILDLGCGVGRLPIGILAKGLEIESYWGVDVDERSIRWCKKYIESKHSKFQFQHTNARNALYNPKGAELDTHFRLPFDDGSVDIIYMYSVFSHMLTDDIRLYTREFKRILAMGGSAFLTAFVEENVPDVVENPVGYKMAWNGALHCVRYNSAFLSGLFKQAGFQVANFDHGLETDGQSGIYLVHSQTGSSK